MQKDAFLFGTYITLVAIAISQPIELLHNCFGHLNLEDICKLIDVATRMEICNQHIPNVYDGYAQNKDIIDINHDAASQTDLAYNLVHLDLLGPIIPVGYNGSKYAAFFTNDLLCYQ